MDMFSHNKKSTSSLALCEVCMKCHSKYKCPRCLIRSCSINCIKEHKKQHKCSGLRNRCEQVDKKDMNNLQFLSDYKFLVEIEQKLNWSSDEKKKRNLGRTELFRSLPKYLQRLRIELLKRGTAIEFMPKTFLKRVENTTRYNYKSKKISWHTKWVFDQADITFIEKNIDEDTKLNDIIEKYMEPTERYKNIQEGQDSSLAYYHSASYIGIMVLLKRECGEFIEMVPNKSLRLNLSNQKIVEYPEFYVILKIHSHAYIEPTKDTPIIIPQLANTNKIMVDKNPLDYCNDTASTDEE